MLDTKQLSRKRVVIIGLGLAGAVGVILIILSFVAGNVAAGYDASAKQYADSITKTNGDTKKLRTVLDAQQKTLGFVPLGGLLNASYQTSQQRQDAMHELDTTIRWLVEQPTTSAENLTKVTKPIYAEYRLNLSNESGSQLTSAYSMDDLAEIKKIEANYLAKNIATTKKFKAKVMAIPTGKIAPVAKEYLLETIDASSKEYVTRKDKIAKADSMGAAERSRARSNTQRSLLTNRLAYAGSLAADHDSNRADYINHANKALKQIATKKTFSEVGGAVDGRVTYYRSIMESLLEKRIKAKPGSIGNRTAVVSRLATYAIERAVNESEAPEGAKKTYGTRLEVASRMADVLNYRMRDDDLDSDDPTTLSGRAGTIYQIATDIDETANFGAVQSSVSLFSKDVKNERMEFDQARALFKEVLEIVRPKDVRLEKTFTPFAKALSICTEHRLKYYKDMSPFFSEQQKLSKEVKAARDKFDEAASKAGTTSAELARLSDERKALEAKRSKAREGAAFRPINTQYKKDFATCLPDLEKTLIAVKKQSMDRKTLYTQALDSFKQL